MAIFQHFLAQTDLLCMHINVCTETQKRNFCHWWEAIVLSCFLWMFLSKQGFEKRRYQWARWYSETD